MPIRSCRLDLGDNERPSIPAPASSLHPPLWFLVMRPDGKRGIMQGSSRLDPRVRPYPVLASDTSRPNIMALAEAMRLADERAAANKVGWGAVYRDASRVQKKSRVRTRQSKRDAYVRHLDRQAKEFASLAMQAVRDGKIPVAGARMGEALG